MPGTILGVSTVWTKLASGNVLMQVLRSGAVIVEVVLLSSDVTNMNTNVNGGSTSATRTFTYTQDQNKTDYEPSSYQEV